MRVVTLLPAATEIVMALGGADSLVGVSHECDYPPSVARLPRVTSSPIDPSAPSARHRCRGPPPARRRAARSSRWTPRRSPGSRPTSSSPRTSARCAPWPTARSTGSRSSSGPRPPCSRSPRAPFRESGTTSARWARALDLDDEADELVAGLREPAARPAGRVARATPRVLCVEWLDPLYLAGHWVPELVAAAGGIDVGAAAGQPLGGRPWSSVAELRPDLSW